MKILVVQESDWIKRGPHNSHHLLERLSEKGHEIRVIDYEINWSDDEKHELVSKRMEIKDYHKLRDKARITVVRPAIVKVIPFNYASLLYTHKKEIEKQIKEYRPDIVIGLGIINAYLAIRECRKNNIPFVYFILDTLHTLVHEPIFRSFARQIEMSNYRYSTKVISVNKSLMDYATTMGAKDNKSILLPHGVEYSRFLRSPEEREAVRRKYGWGPKDTILFFMGYLYEFSGLVRLARRIEEEPARYAGIRLFIVGEGPIYDQLKRIGQRIPDRITLLGWQPYAEIPSIASASDICILPAELNDTMNDIVPIKILEYMAAGKPVIVTRLPGVVREFGEDSGISYVDEPEGVLEEACRLVSSGNAQSEGQKARRAVSDRDWELLAIRFESLLEDMRSGRKTI